MKPCRTHWFANKSLDLCPKCGARVEFKTMKKELLSKCCKEPLLLSGGGESTYHYVCKGCEKPADIFVDNLVDNKEQKKCECSSFVCSRVHKDTPIASSFKCCNCGKHILPNNAFCSVECENMFHGQTHFTPTEKKCEVRGCENRIHPTYVKCTEHLNASPTPMEKKCVPDGMSYFSVPTQYKCQNCGQFWFSTNQTPTCRPVEMNTIFPTPTKKECECDPLNLISTGHCINCGRYTFTKTPTNPIVQTDKLVDWEEEFREYFDKTLRPKTVTMGALDRELCINFIKNEKEKSYQEGKLVTKDEAFKQYGLGQREGIEYGRNSAIEEILKEVEGLLEEQLPKDEMYNDYDNGFLNALSKLKEKLTNKK